MKLLALLITVPFLSLNLWAGSPQVLLLWENQSPPHSIPADLEEYEAECWGGALCVFQVVTPTLTLFIPEQQTNRNAVIVLPGGGYEVQAIYHEGYEIAEALARRGTVAAVLKYRLPNPATSTAPEMVPLMDVRQALRILRREQSRLNFSVDRIGVMGFSAGSHLATLASVHFADESDQNPDFSMLIYGVTRLNRENHESLEKTLYHRAMNAEEIKYQTLLDQVSDKTPPAFLVHALDDDVCHYTESTLYAEALTRLRIPAEIHLFAQGGHGFGPGRVSDGTDQWLSLAANWLNRLGNDASTGY